MTAAHPRLCLNMIVRNEAAIIERCLASVAPYIECWVIVDTGSSDHTAQLIEAFMRAAGCPGELHHEPFSDFSTSRNHALDLCRASERAYDYILFIDADMELLVTDVSALENLAEPAYSVEQRNQIAYYNTRLLRREHPARYRGVTHEYLDIGHDAEPLKGLSMLDHACGSNRAGKFERDITLLELGLADEPENLRYRFYLAQSLRDAGRPGEALEHYRLRAAAGGWEEEAWYAGYRAADCLLQMGRFADFAEAALASWQRRPWRIEPLALLARHYREAGRHDEACRLAVIGRTAAYPRDDRLFIEPAAYHWSFTQELSISGYYASDPQHRRLGRACCEQLALNRKVPADVRHQARQNLHWYADSATGLPGLTNIQQIRPGTAADRPSTNPSVAVDGDERCLLMRQVNYRIENGRYHVADPDQVIRTENLLLRLNAENKTSACTLLPDVAGSAAIKRTDFPVKGFEDCRLFHWQGRWCATASVRDTRKDGRSELVLLELDSEGNIEREALLRGPWSEEHQKNWMPLIRDEQLLLVYSLSPTRVLAVDPDTRLARPVGHTETPFAAEHLRGGSQFVRVQHPGLDGWLGICHEVIMLEPGRRRYLHRFCALDLELRLSALSDCFSLSGEDIEFCAGLALDQHTSNLLVSFGVNDARAMLAEFPLERAVSQLWTPAMLIQAVPEAPETRSYD